MDQGRLEELKRLLQKRHQEPKRDLEQNSNGKNSKVSNFETKNSEVSNFEASNSRTLNFEASNFEILNSEPPNFESLNSKALNSATDALNLEGNLETEAAQNSACENNAEPQNFISDDNGSLQQNSKARDYDKDPIIIKDNTIEMIKFYSPFLYFLNFIDFGTRQDSPRSVKRWLGLPSKFGTCYIKFKNSVIEYYSEKKRATLYSINLSEIIAIKRTFGPSTFKMTKKR
nr:hypothetical protein [uncultured Campylobacter sp.]